MTKPNLNDPERIFPRLNLNDPHSAKALIGFYTKTKYFVSYQEQDGHPSLLGRKIVEEIRSVISKNPDFMEDWRKQFDRLKVVYDQDIPTPEDIQKLKPYTDLNVSRCSENDWFCLTYKSIHSLSTILECGYLYNYVEETGMPFFQDYSYILNFDSHMLDVYEDYRVNKSYYLEYLPNW